MKETKLIIHICPREECGHQWAGRGGIKKPKQCPKCKCPIRYDVEVKEEAIA